MRLGGMPPFIFGPARLLGMAPGGRSRGRAGGGADGPGGAQRPDARELNGLPREGGGGGARHAGVPPRPWHRTHARSREAGGTFERGFWVAGLACLSPTAGQLKNPFCSIAAVTIARQKATAQLPSTQRSAVPVSVARSILVSRPRPAAAAPGAHHTNHAYNLYASVQLRLIQSVRHLDLRRLSVPGVKGPVSASLITLCAWWSIRSDHDACSRLPAFKGAALVTSRQQGAVCTCASLRCR